MMLFLVLQFRFVDLQIIEHQLLIKGCETICLILFLSQICDHLIGLSIRMDGSDGYAGQSRVVESEITGCVEMVSRARVILASQRHWRGGSINHSC